ncbi:MAG: UbiH/UbiF/VisC/COQ6 family ubiquinone biosynthesis hydroxylase [Mangrovicoccus sp.]|nr:UbiH/UbiF/VisC/COQ6 family ubiquinone biosynthesis hydroxylase [Mangrovicoccus sp.]
MAQDPILIVGGGLNGTALALELAQAGLPVTLLDSLPRETRDDGGFDGRGYALALASQRMLEALGLWAGLADQAEPILGVKVCDGRVDRGPGPFVMEFDHNELEEGPLGYMLEDRFLRQALLAATADQPGLSEISGVTVEDQKTDAQGVELTLSNGNSLRGSLLIGADGRGGAVAGRAGISREVTDYQQTALVCAIAHEQPHQGIAHQYFLPPGPLAILPLPVNRSSIVWSETRAQAEAIHALPDADFLEVLRPRFGDFLGEISLAGKRFTYPLNRVLARSFIADRVALVGDAVRGVHPIAGQGLNGGLRDVAVLAEVLIDAQRRGEDIASPLVLDRYQSWRRADSSALAFSTDAFNRLFSNDNPLLRLGRGLGLAAVNASPMLRRAFMREAAGLSGDLPRIMRGGAL